MQDKITLNNILGYKEEKESIQKIIELLKNYNKYSEQGVSIPRGLIFQGPPGTGKTLFAKAIAGECKYKFFTVFKNEVEEESVIKTLKEVFKEAEKHSENYNTPCLIYIDELDKITYVNNQNELYDKDVREATRFLLQKLDETKFKNKILIIASTNNYGRIPEALLRSGRFDKKLLIDVPNFESRKEILKYYINNHKLFSNININKLALKTNGMSGADIKTLINNTLVEYITVKNKLEDDDFIKVINEMHFETIGKKWNTPDKVLSVLVHEVGHSVVSGVLTGNFGEISAIKYGDIGGSTCFETPCTEYDDIEKEHQEIQQVINSIVISFGGMASEKIVLKESSMGISGDFFQIDDMLRYLMDASYFGFKYSGNIFRLTDKSNEARRKLSVKLAKKYYRKACNIIKNNIHLIYYLIQEVHKNNDVLSSTAVQSRIDYFNEHKKELIHKYKNYNIKELIDN